MKKFNKVLLAGLSVLFFIVISSCRKAFAAGGSITGAWEMQKGSLTHVLLFADGYFTHTTFDKINKNFVQTRGGTCQINNGKLTAMIEFDTQQKEQVGQSVTYAASIDSDQLTTDVSGSKDTWKRTDDGKAGLAGNWRITAQMRGDKIEPIHQTGTRKTIKLLTGNRFQWAAINPGTKEFSGTGGGTYTFKDGKYTETIEFFSRDSNRVGASLTFDGKLENGDWHHSGLSSKGDKIYEVWSRK